MSITANFSSSTVRGFPPLVVYFSDVSTSSSTITSWAWDFGDSTTSTSQNPIKGYSLPGYYTVSLTVTNSALESNNKTVLGYIHVDLVGRAQKFTYIHVAGSLKTWDLAPPLDRPLLRIMIARGSAQWKTSLTGVNGRLLKGSGTLYNSGFKRGSGPSLIFD